MAAYKQFLTSDIIITPFEVHKEFTFYGNELVDFNVGIERLLGQNIINSLFEPLIEPTTGQLGSQYQRLVYNSIKELYYSNYLTCSYGDIANLPILIPGVDEEGDMLIGSSSTTNYHNYLQTTLSYPRFFPSESNALIGVISIPVRLFGDYIEPYSFNFISDSGSLTDDGEGNILSGSSIVGNIFYPHGIITITSASSDVITNFITSSNITCSFNSSYKIYETQYKCTIRENEFNYTLNPSTFTSSMSASSATVDINPSPCIIELSTLTGSILIPGIPYEYVNKDYFSPYITTIGLYNEAQELLAVAKLSQPLPTSPTTDTTILINIDR